MQLTDASAPLLAWAIEALAGDQALAAAMGGQAKAYDIVPTGATKPYIAFDGPTLEADLAECVDGGELLLTVHIWSLTDPPGRAQAMAIAAAALPVLLQAPALDGFSLGEPRPGTITHLTDRDGKTAHSIVPVFYPCDAL